MTKILHCIPAFGNMLTTSTFLTVLNLSQVMAARGIGGGISALSFPDIAELRDMFLTIWYDTLPDHTHILFTDADMAYPPELVLDMLLLDEAIVGTIYRQRRPEISWAGSGTGEPTTERRGNFMKVEGVGMGCTLIRRDAITTMLEKMPEIVDKRLELHPAKDTLRAAGASRLIRAFDKLDLPERGVVSEDLSFCLRWNKCGGSVWASIGHKVSHVGMYSYDGRYLDQFENAVGGQPPIPLGTNVAPQSVPALPSANTTAEMPVMGGVEQAPVAVAAE